VLLCLVVNRELCVGGFTVCKHTFMQTPLGILWYTGFSNFFSGAFQRANWMMQTISPQHSGEAKPVRAKQGGTASGVGADWPANRGYQP